MNVKLKLVANCDDYLFIFFYRARLCMLLRIIGRFCCSSLQKAWTVDFKETLEGLANEDNETVSGVSISF